MLSTHSESWDFRVLHERDPEEISTLQLLSSQEAAGSNPALAPTVLPPLKSMALHDNDGCPRAQGQMLKS